MKIKKYLALVLCVILCVQILPVMTFATETEYSISGNGVKVTFDGEELTLHRLDGTTSIQMSNPSAMGYPIVDGEAVQDFAVTSCSTQQDITGVMGTGERMTITSTSASTGLTRTYTLEVSDTEEGVIYTTTTYAAGSSAVAVDTFVDNVFEVVNTGTYLWSYNGGGEGPMHYYDTIQKIDLTDSSTFTRENIQNETAASIPVADVYTANGGITVGDASVTRREVRTPVEETSGSAKVHIKWPGENIAAGSTVDAGESIVVVHSGDYYSGLRGYKEGMEHVGVTMQTIVADSQSFDLRWEAWGWGTNWTVDLIIGILDQLEAVGIKQVTVDDGWYENAGDWDLDPSKFPNGNSDMIRLVDAIHDHGMTAILWWRPCDGGTNSTLYQEHPEYFVENENGSTANLLAPGGTNLGLNYALCPGSQGAIESQVAFINTAMNTWGFDGFKGDYVWSMPKCYNEEHNHAYPEESTEKQAELYRTAWEAMVANDADCFNLLCNCGTPQDYYSLQYVTQVATADPTSLDQTRRRVKAYKALMGDSFPVTTDHNEIWYPSAVGTGAVLIEKRALTGTNLEEYERWLTIADTVQLHRGQFIGDLYSYGFDPYETYVVDKDGIMHYAFYRDGSKYAPTGNPDIELKGLDPDKMYRIVDYVNDRVVATNLMGDEATFSCSFSSYLLVKAVEITTPDDESVVDPDWGYTSVDCTDNALSYTGAWVDDSNSAFDNGTAKYTNTAESSVEFTFAGTAIRWYGQKDTNFGSADVYLDGELVDTVSANGSMATNQLLFDASNLEPAYHTIKIVCTSPVIDIDRFAYIPSVVYEIVDDTSEEITYGGTWSTLENEQYYNGSQKCSNEDGAYAEFTFVGTAIRWYGETSTSYGMANVYLDGEFVESVVLYGQDSVGKLLIEQTGLSAEEHTIRIEHDMGAMNIDYFAYISAESTTEPDEPEELTNVDDTSDLLVYSGTWQSDSNDAFHAGSAHYTSTAEASVALTFTGTTIRWYGQKDTNFGTALVYLDDQLVATVNVNGEMATGQLLFEQTDLTEGGHTICIVCQTPVVDLDYFSYG